MIDIIDRPKRVRSSKSRDRRFYQAKSELVTRWRAVYREHRPLHDAFTAIQDWIRSLDVTTTQRATLRDQSWALRDLAVAEHARWQLYLDGDPRTFDEIAAVAHEAERAASTDGPGPAHEAYLGVMRRICGRHEWGDSHDPFYADEPPGLLNSSER